MDSNYCSSYEYSQETMFIPLIFRVIIIDNYVVIIEHTNIVQYLYRRQILPIF